MAGAMKLSVVVSIIAILVIASCAKVPPEDQGSPSGKSGSTDPNNNATAKPDESAGSTAGLSTAKTVPADTKAGSQQRNIPYEIDIKSGDFRGVIYTPDGSSRYGIYESELSKEVRRLGIPIPDQRRWVEFYGGPGFGGMEVNYVYRPLLPAVRRLLELLDQVNATDEERRSVLERFMASLRTEKAPDAINNANALSVEVANRHGRENPL